MVNADRVAALVALVAAVLAGTGLPSRLGLGPQAVAVAGGLVVGFASVLRALLATKWDEGQAPNWRDLLGAMLGAVAIGLGIEGVAVDQLDPDAMASLSSLAAMLFAWQRGGGGGITKPPTAGLLLLVGLAGCASMAAQTFFLFGVTVAVAIMAHSRWKQ